MKKLVLLLFAFAPFVVLEAQNDTTPYSEGFESWGNGFDTSWSRFTIEEFYGDIYGNHSVIGDKYYIYHIAHSTFASGTWANVHVFSGGNILRTLGKSQTGYAVAVGESSSGEWSIFKTKNTVTGNCATTFLQSFSAMTITIEPLVSENHSPFSTYSPTSIMSSSSLSVSVTTDCQ